MQDRDYQIEAKAAAYAKLEDHRSTLVVMPTGTGKGRLIGSIGADAVANGRRVLTFVHREEIVDQLAGHLELASGVRPAIEQGDRREATDDSLLVVGSVPSLVRRLDRFPRNRFDLLMPDEAHHGLAATWRTLLEHFAPAKVIAFTATPDRGDEKALAQVYETVAFDMSIVDAINLGWLVPLRSVEVQLKHADLRGVRKRNGDLLAGDLEAVLTEVEVLREAVGPLLDLAGNLQTMVFCATVAHMRCVAATIEKMADERGLQIAVATIDGNTPKDERRATVDAFRSGDVNFLCSVETMTEGVDVPGVEAVAMLRFTLSRALYMQMFGRGMRPLSGLVDCWPTPLQRRAAIAASAKPNLLVIDFTTNTSSHPIVKATDLLAGDYELPDQHTAKQMVRDGRAPDLLTALEMARRERLGRIVEARARAGDPFALFNLPLAKDRFDRAQSETQAAILRALRIPRVLDWRESDTVLRELARRSSAKPWLCTYQQAALLAKLGFPIEEIPDLTFARALELQAKAGALGWKLSGALATAAASPRRA